MDQIDFPTGYGMNANTQFVYLTPPPIVRQYGSSHTDIITPPPPIVRQYGSSHTDIIPPPPPPPPPIVRQYGSSHTDVTNLSVVRKLSF